MPLVHREGLAVTTHRSKVITFPSKFKKGLLPKLTSMRLVVTSNMQIPVRVSSLSGTQFGPDPRRLVCLKSTT